MTYYEKLQAKILEANIINEISQTPVSAGALRTLQDLGDTYEEGLKNTLDDFSKFAMTQGSNFSEEHYHNVINSYLKKDNEQLPG